MNSFSTKIHEMTPWLQAILDDYHDAVFITNAEFGIVHQNQAALQFVPALTYGPGHKNMLTLLQQLFSFENDLNSPLKRVMQGDLPEEAIQLTSRDGKQVMLTCYTHTLPGTYYLLDVIFILRHIDARLPQLAETEIIFRSFMNNSHSPAWIVDEDGMIVYMNDLFREVWKLNDSHLRTNLYDHLPDELAREYIDNHKKVLESGFPFITIENSFRSDGSPGVYLVHKFLLQTSHAKQLIGGQAFDITEERRAQEEIVKSNERFYYAAKATSDCIWDWNIEAGHIYRSDAFNRLTGYAQHEVGSDLYWWYDRIHPGDRERVIQQINNCILSHNSYMLDEYRFRCADNQYKYFSDKGYIVYKKGQAVRAIGAIQDLTEKRKLEAALAMQKEQERIQINQAIIQAQDHERNEISKELHDNVNQILSSASILLSTLKGAPDADPLIEKTSQYVDLAIQELRRISRSLNSSMINEVGLQGPVEEIVENIRLTQHIDIEFDYDEEIEDEVSHPIQLMLYRIVQEQTSNIIHHAEATYALIAIKKIDDRLHLLIEDNGKGFDLQQPTKGTGLINIRNRVESAGGSLQIDTQPGKGCSLNIEVPVKSDLP